MKKQRKKQRSNKRKKKIPGFFFCNGSMHVFLEEEDESLIKKNIRYIPEG